MHDQCQTIFPQMSMRECQKHMKSQKPIES